MDGFVKYNINFRLIVDDWSKFRVEVIVSQRLFVGLFSIGPKAKLVEPEYTVEELVNNTNILKTCIYKIERKARK